MSLFERYLTVWVGLCILLGIGLGRVAPGLAQTLDGVAIHVSGAPIVSIPIAICLFCMMYPIMVKIDFGNVVRAGRAIRPLGLTLFLITPFTRLVHIWSAPVWFLLRPGYQIVRSRRLGRARSPTPTATTLLCCARSTSTRSASSGTS